MALQQGGECFAKWTHTEAGQQFSRRLHRIVLETPDGVVKRITGDKLPDSIQTWAEHAYAGPDLGRTLLSSGSLPYRLRRRVPRLPAMGGWWLSQDVRTHLAAERQAFECSTRLDHLENGPPLHRQIRRIEVQQHWGLLRFTGNKLPVFIGIYTGPGYKGKHTAQILLSSSSDSDWLEAHSYSPATVNAWPELRDVLHVALGFVGFLAVRFFLNLIVSIS